ncbi:hypothetical protein D3OALGA1CA_1687 [Olavius algarvensis associated proteobacterium Delta 3]|nr:hypothetical protein D3OALGA1CA_1687 [Olavius algarvensis associated proteobacterium Delta 3]
MITWNQRTFFTFTYLVEFPWNRGNRERLHHLFSLHAGL